MKTQQQNKKKYVRKQFAAYNLFALNKKKQLNRPKCQGQSRQLF